MEPRFGLRKYCRRKVHSEEVRRSHKLPFAVFFSPESTRHPKCPPLLLRISFACIAVSLEQKEIPCTKKSLGELFARCSLALPFPARAQQPKKVPRIGYLSSFDPASESARSEAIRLALRERGYIEGQNIAIEYRYAEGKLDRFPELAAELVRLKVDIIVVAGGARRIRAAKNATKTIPIVMVGAGLDPVEAGLVESLARPGGNVTGITNLARELGGKRLELLKEAVPKACPCRGSLRSGQSGSVREVKEVLPVAARALRLTLQPWEVRDADDFERVFAALSKQRPDGLYVAGRPANEC